MLELVVTFCLLAAPTECKTRGMVYSDQELTQMQLMAQAQPVIAQWMDEHPGHSVQRWTVRRVGLFVDI
jgi:hypothetical protein